jgi:crotonobetainyl-CoA:carnitine CoA-transferase CaiB-like acyl-CoA transferase
MSGPLEGIRVLDLSRILAGPYCSMILGDLGADVIKVERPKTGDDTRSWGPPFAGGESAYFICLNRNKRSLTLNLQTQKGVQILKELVKLSDVLIENFSVGTMEKLGIGWEVLSQINPRLIFCSITGFGPDGPSKNKQGYDVLVSSVGGLMSITGEQEGNPVKVGVAITDVVTGVYAQGAIVTALYARDRTGRGQRIDLSLLETQVASLVNMASSYLLSGEVPKRWGTAHESIVPYQSFKAKDRFVTICVGNDSLWAKFCQAIGRPDLTNHPKFRTNPLRVQNRKELIGILEGIISQKTAQEWVKMLDTADVPVGPINTLDEVFKDPQVLHRGMLVEVDHPTAGRIKIVGIPVKYSNTKPAIRLPPPTLGQHTDQILSELLKYTPAQLDQLRAQKVI